MSPAMVAAAAGFCCCRSSNLCAVESMAGRLAPTTQRALTAAISAGLKPLSSLWGSKRSSGLGSGLGLELGAVAPVRRYYGEGDCRGVSSSWGGRPNSTAAQAYEQYGGQQQQQRQQEQQEHQPEVGQQQEQEMSRLPRPPVIQWEKDLANAVQLIGNVGKDFTLKYLASGKVVANSTLAVRKGTNKMEEPSWFDLEIWDSLAEIAAHHVSKGEQIFVTGRIVVDRRVKDETTYVSAKVVVNDLCFVESYSPRGTYGQVDEEIEVKNDMIIVTTRQKANMGSPQRNWNQQQQLAGQPSQEMAGRKGPVNDDVNLATEKRWQEYFADPTQWWDNRGKKRNPKSPDFKHKSTQEALWVDSWSNPPWVQQQMALLEEKKAQHPGGFDRSASKKLSSFKDSDFLH